ncbi:hypothetical protein CCR95_05550 [Thiocystis minor]|nr:hypothetical protein [Thiocystis minor]
MEPVDAIPRLTWMWLAERTVRLRLPDDTEYRVCSDDQVSVPTWPIAQNDAKHTGRPVSLELFPMESALKWVNLHK